WSSVARWYALPPRPPARAVGFQMSPLARNAISVATRMMADLRNHRAIPNLHESGHLRDRASRRWDVPSQDRSFLSRVRRRAEPRQDPGLLEGARDAHEARVRPARPDDLDADGKTVAVEPGRRGERGGAGEGAGHEGPGDRPVGHAPSVDVEGSAGVAMRERVRDRRGEDERIDAVEVRLPRRDEAIASIEGLEIPGKRALLVAELRVGGEDAGDRRDEIAE